MLVAVGAFVDMVGGGSDDWPELSVRPFADFDDRPRIVAFSMREPTRVMLGLSGVKADERQAFIEMHLRELYLDPLAGDPLVWTPLLATLADLGIDCRVEQLRALPFEVDFGD